MNRSHTQCALALACAAFLLAPPGSVAADPASKERVVVLHGLGRSSLSMWLLASRLEDAGFRVHNLDYPSTTETVDELVLHLQEQLEACCLDSVAPLHFVTHSMGGLLVRAYVAKARPSQLGRVVMLSPPNHGSELSDELRDNPLFQWTLGPMGQDLGTGPSSFPSRLGPADFEVGIIAGNSSVNPIGSWIVGGDDDGTVSVQSARLQGMADFLILPHGHTNIMNSSQVAEETIYFLRHGHFSSPKRPDEKLPGKRLPDEATDG